ncbi:hypothetical protein Moror_17853 [Moniliophthora roreri MCA 2997]|uniref:Uncharacterized protein n=1 Tax=Moniliophthora roreri (strain MCA 2997) TaxID=1381753 RepID=V2XDM6_MONRO|nr:hypothetical protein Moror_17853 [Moniliophthora roreri MCA 2997]
MKSILAESMKDTIVSVHFGSFFIHLQLIFVLQFDMKYELTLDYFDSLPFSASGSDEHPIEQESYTLSAFGVMTQDDLYPRGSMRLVISRPPARATKFRRARVRQVIPFRIRLAGLFPETQLTLDDDTP